MRRGPVLLALLAAVATFAACGGSDLAGGQEAGPPEAGAPSAATDPAVETGEFTETNEFAETGGGQPATTAATPERTLGGDPLPPSIVLESQSGQQEAVQGSYCIEKPSEGIGLCADAGPIDPAELTIVTPGQTVRLAIVDAVVRVPEKASADVASTVTVSPLGCDAGDGGTFELTSASTAWTVDLEPGAYQLAVFAYFETAHGATGDTYGVLGLLVDPDREPAIIPVDERLAVCPYPSSPDRPEVAAAVTVASRAQRKPYQVSSSLS